MYISIAALYSDNVHGRHTIFGVLSSISFRFSLFDTAMPNVMKCIFVFRSTLRHCTSLCWHVNNLCNLFSWKLLCESDEHMHCRSRSTPIPRLKVVRTFTHLFNTISINNVDKVHFPTYMYGLFDTAVSLGVCTWQNKTEFCRTTDSK
jgi:hypothetical protein